MGTWHPPWPLYISQLFEFKGSACECLCAYTKKRAEHAIVSTHNVSPETLRLWLQTWLVRLSAGPQHRVPSTMAPTYSSPFPKPILFLGKVQLRVMLQRPFEWFFLVFTRNAEMGKITFHAKAVGLAHPLSHHYQNCSKALLLHHELYNFPCKYTVVKYVG